MMGASVSATRRKAIGGAVCVTLMCLALGAAVFTSEARAQELGLTPSHVFGLWTNINAALVLVADTSSGGLNLDDSLTSTKPGRFENKKPADVLARAIEFRAKLDRLLAEHGMAPTEQYSRGAGRVTPSVVFLNSGLLLDAVVGWIIANTSKQQLVSPFYAHHAFSGKTPSDVYGMVDLADRRIDRILATDESCHSFVQEPINCSTP